MNAPGGAHVASTPSESGSTFNAPTEIDGEEALVTDQPTDPSRPHPPSPDDQGHAPWALARRYAKGIGP